MIDATMLKDTDLNQFQSDMVTMKSDMSDVKSSIKTIADALTKLAILDERQTNQYALIEKSLTWLERLEEKNHATELRFATVHIAMDQIKEHKNKLERLETLVAAREVERQTVGVGVKVFWAIAGSAITALVTVAVSKALAAAPVIATIAPLLLL